MNDNAKKWIKALRSGEYKQGKEKLRVDDTYCCLGVACELFNRETGRGEWIQFEKGFDFSDGSGDVNDVILPKAVQEWLGLTNQGGYAEIQNTGITTSLDKLNDDNFNFNYIADYIETNQDNLFT